MCASTRLQCPANGIMRSLSQLYSQSLCTMSGSQILRERILQTMKSLTYILAGCLAVGMAASLWADVDPDFQTAMKGAAAAIGKVKKNVDAKANAEDMAKDAEDAMQLSREAFGAAMGISKAAKAGNMDEAATQFKALTGTCAGCHKAH